MPLAMLQFLAQKMLQYLELFKYVPLIMQAIERLLIQGFLQVLVMLGIKVRQTVLLEVVILVHFSLEDMMQDLLIIHIIHQGLLDMKPTILLIINLI